MPSQPIRLEGYLEKLSKELFNIITKIEKKFSRKPKFSPYLPGIVFGLFGLTAVFAFLSLLNTAFMIGMFVSALAMVASVVFFRYPQKAFLSLQPLVKYRDLPEIVNALPKYFPGERVVITLYTDYKTEKIFRTFIKK